MLRFGGEDAAIWEIVAGELVAQRYEPFAEAGSEALVRRAGIMAMRAGEVIRPATSTQPGTR